MIAEMSERTRMSGGRLADLYRDQSAGAWRLAYLLTGDRTLADDLVQDAFVRIAGRFLDFRDRAGAAAYVRKTVTSLAMSRFRRAALERSNATATRAATDGDGTGPVDDRDALWRALAALPDRQRAALVLRFYEDLPDEQIADTLSCRPATVRSLLSRGLAALRERIPDEQP